MFQVNPGRRGSAVEDAMSGKGMDADEGSTLALNPKP